MERIDIFTPNYVDCPSFTVNIAATFVQVSNMVSEVILYPADNSKYKFERGDNFQVLSAGYLIPEKFSFYGSASLFGTWSPAMVLELDAYKLTAAVWINLTQFGNLGSIKLPFPNYETALGVSIDSESVIGEAFNLGLRFPRPFGFEAWRISMAGVPAAIDGIEFKIIPFIKVLHNFELYG